MAEVVETFNQLPIAYNSSTKLVSSTLPDAALASEITTINTYHKALTAPNTDAHDGTPPPPTAVNPKRSANISKLRESGNQAFRSQKYDDSIRMYSLAIDMALGRPLWEPSALVREELSALYANRAQAYMAQENWPEGAVDAKVSVELKKVGNVKAWWRRGKCLVEMGRTSEADDWLSEGIEFESDDAELIELLNEIRLAGYQNNGEDDDDDEDEDEDEDEEESEEEK
jgi:translocation protein SEC72